MLTKDLAICIRAVDYSETSQVVTFFARATGKISAIAKGSKRPKSAFDGPIEVLSVGEIVFSNSSREKLATLTEFQQHPGFTDLAGSLLTLNCALFAGELVSQLTNDYDPHPQLFDSFLQFLKDMREMGHERRETLSLLILFQLALLREIGLMPILNACANCKTTYVIRDTKYEYYFSSSANGLVCRDCEASFPDKIRLTDVAAACLANPKNIALAQKQTMKEIEKVLISHFTVLLSRPLKMTKQIVKNLNIRW
jgi:DNA repair protein RecO (recombination protein O)